MIQFSDVMLCYLPQAVHYLMLLTQCYVTCLLSLTLCSRLPLTVMRFLRFNLELDTNPIVDFFFINKIKCAEIIKFEITFTNLICQSRGAYAKKMKTGNLDKFYTKMTSCLRQNNSNLHYVFCGTQKSLYTIGGIELLTRQKITTKWMGSKDLPQDFKSYYPAGELFKPQSKYLLTILTAFALNQNKKVHKLLNDIEA